MQYGHFDVERKEYVVTNPVTPTPWINYLGSGKYGGIISNTAGGYSFHIDPQNRRITRYRYNNFPMDRPGRYFYIRHEDGEYWNPGLQPTQNPIENYSCRHGMGYTIIKGEKNHVEAESTYFIPDEKDFEIWMLKLTNKSDSAQKLKVFSYAEFCFWLAVLDQQNVDWAQQINQGRYEDGIITYYPHYLQESAAFVATTEQVHSYDTNLEKFMGPYRGPENPIAVEQGFCNNSISYRQNGVGAFCVEVELKAGETKEMAFYLGYAEDKTKIREMITPYFSIDKAKEALQRLNHDWDNYLSKLHVETPDDDMNLFVNVWNQYQSKTTFYWSRSVSMYQLGIGRGMGIRDSAQDTLGVMHTIPGETKKLIHNLLKCQYPDGKAYHLYYPLTGKGDTGEAPGKAYSWYSDDHLWLILAVNAYIKETGDIEILDEQVLYNDEKTRGTVLEHLEKALDFTMQYRGPHNLALAGKADWNDGLNLDMGNGIAESVFTSMLFCRACVELGDLCTYLNNNALKDKVDKYHKKMSDAINDVCWDGSWYIRAFDDEGKVVGTDKSDFAKIFVNAQSWAVMGNIAPEDRREAALQSVDDMMNTKYGIVLVYPAFPKHDPKIGGMTTYPPGAKENGGIFCHTNPWTMIAETIVGNGERAFQYYKQILPANRNDDADVYEVEPYVYSQNILGKEHPQFGIGRNSWLSGTSSWNMVASAQYILGVRPWYDSLIVDPCIPASWDSFKVRRIFRGATYNIIIKNPDHVSKGVKEIYVDGNNVEKIPVFDAGETHEVKVVMG